MKHRQISNHIEVPAASLDTTGVAAKELCPCPVQRHENLVPEADLAEGLKAAPRQPCAEPHQRPNDRDIHHRPVCRQARKLRTQCQIQSRCWAPISSAINRPGSAKASSCVLRTSAHVCEGAAVEVLKALGVLGQLHSRLDVVRLEEAGQVVALLLGNLQAGDAKQRAALYQHIARDKARSSPGGAAYRPTLNTRTCAVAGRARSPRSIVFSSSENCSRSSCEDSSMFLYTDDLSLPPCAAWKAFATTPPKRIDPTLLQQQKRKQPREDGRSARMCHPCMQLVRKSGVPPCFCPLGARTGRAAHPSRKRACSARCGNSSLACDIMLCSSASDSFPSLLVSAFSNSSSVLSRA